MHWSSFDRQIRYCAEVGKSETTRSPTASAVSYPLKGQYHFQRYNSASRHDDYYAIPRNKALYSYLQVLMEAPVPGVDESDGVRNHESFVRKYGQHDSDQILTQIFDYIRSTNLHDDLMLREHKHDPWSAPSGAVEALWVY